MATNAAARAFGIEEILENILFYYAYETGHVEPRTSFAKRMPQRLFNVRRVSRDFNNTIVVSKTVLHRLMFLQPTDTSNLHTKLPCHSPVQWLIDEVLRFAMHSYGRNHKESGFRGTISLSRFKDLAKRLRYLGDAWKRPEASWRNMLSCNASQEKSSFTLNIKIKDRSQRSNGSVTYKWTFGGQSKLSEVFDRFVELAEVVGEEIPSNGDWERVDGLVENTSDGQTFREYHKIRARQARTGLEDGERKLRTYQEYLWTLPKI